MPDRFRNIRKWSDSILGHRYSVCWHLVEKLWILNRRTVKLQEILNQSRSIRNWLDPFFTIGTMPVDIWTKNHEYWAIELWNYKNFWKCPLRVPTGVGSRVSGSGDGQIHCRSSAQCLLTSGWKTTNLEPPNCGVARNSERPLRNRFRSIRKCPDSMLIRQRTFVNSRVFSSKFKDVLTNAGQHLGAKFVSSVVEVVS